MWDTLIRFSLINTVTFLSISLKSAGMFEDEDTALPTANPQMWVRPLKMMRSAKVRFLANWLFYLLSYIGISTVQRKLTTGQFRKLSVVQLVSKMKGIYRPPNIVKHIMHNTARSPEWHSLVHVLNGTWTSDSIQPDHNSKNWSILLHLSGIICVEGSYITARFLNVPYLVPDSSGALSYCCRAAMQHQTPRISPRTAPSRFLKLGISALPQFLVSHLLCCPSLEHTRRAGTVGGLEGLERLDPSSHTAQHQEPTFAICISFTLPQVKFYKAGGGVCVCVRVWLSCFLSRGHTSGVRTKTKRRSKGCHSRRPPKPRTVCAADRRSPARGRLRRGHRGPPGLRGGLKGVGGRGPLSGAVGWPRDPPPRAPSRDLSAASEPLPASRRLPLRRREAAGAGGRARPSPLRALPGEEPAGSHRARSPSPAPSGQTQPPGLGVGGGGPAGRAPLLQGAGGRAKLSSPATARHQRPPRRALPAWAPTRCSWAPTAGRPPPPCSSGPCACSAGGRGTGAAGGGGAGGGRRIPSRPRRGSGAARREPRRRAAHWAALPSARPSAPGSPISARRRRRRAGLGGAPGDGGPRPPAAAEAGGGAPVSVSVPAPAPLLCAPAAAAGGEGEPGLVRGCGRRRLLCRPAGGGRLSQVGARRGRSAGQAGLASPPVGARKSVLQNKGCAKRIGWPLAVWGVNISDP